VVGSLSAKLLSIFRLGFTVLVCHC